jgi:hypothetical protein
MKRDPYTSINARLTLQGERWGQPSPAAAGEGARTLSARERFRQPPLPVRVTKCRAPEVPGDTTRRAD